MTHSDLLLAACLTMLGLTLVVCVIMLLHRIKVMKQQRIAPQSVALSAQRHQVFADTRLSDNYNHLFELPVVFYMLCGLALLIQHIPFWFVILAWLFVASRIVHSFIQCTSNNVMRRFSVFVLGMAIVILMWIGFILSFIFQ